MTDVKIMVDEAIAIDRRMKEDKKKLDGIKAFLQADALLEMENKNIKYVEYFGDNGSCFAGYKEKFEVDNLYKLCEVVGEVIIGKYKKEETIKITVDEKFKKALIVLYKGDFGKHDIVDVLRQIGLDDKAVKVALKKLKGEYVKDKDLLSSLGAVGDLEEELDEIKEQKNFELVEKFFELDKIDLDKLKKTISVEDTLSIGLSYE